MKQLSDSSPCKERAKFLVNYIDQNKLNTLIYLVETAAEALSEPYTDLLNRLKELESKIVAKEKGYYLASHIHSLQYILLDAMRKNDALVVKEALVNLNQCTLAPRALAFSVYTGSCNDFYFKTLDAVSKKMYGIAFNNSIPDHSISTHSLACLKKALDIMKKCCLSYYEELHEVSDRIEIYDCGFAGGSNFNTFGYIYINNIDQDVTWDRYFYELIHEMTHYYLFALSAYKPITLNHNMDEMYHTPLQDKKRPLYMAFHQLLVISRLIDANYKLTNYYKNTEHLFDDKHHIATLQKQFRQVRKVIESSFTNLTELGQELLHSSIKLARE